MLLHIQHQWIKANLSLSADGYFFLLFPPFFSSMNNSKDFVVMEACTRLQQMFIMVS